MIKQTLLSFVFSTYFIIIISIYHPYPYETKIRSYLRTDIILHNLCYIIYTLVVTGTSIRKLYNCRLSVVHQCYNKPSYFPSSPYVTILGRIHKCICHMYLPHQFVKKHCAPVESSVPFL